MSFQRIISAYAECTGRHPTLNGTDIAVLIALSFRDNEKNGCFPSIADLAQLTHFDEKTVRNACKRLDKEGLIHWDKGGFKNGRNESNNYTFLFKNQRMPSKYETYGRLKQGQEGALPRASDSDGGNDRPQTGGTTCPPRTERGTAPCGTTCRPVGNVLPPPGGTTCPPVRNDVPTNRQIEKKEEKKYNIEIESKGEAKGASLDFDGISSFFEGPGLLNRVDANGTVVAPADTGRSGGVDFRKTGIRVGEGLIAYAMRVTNTTAREDYQTFCHYAFALNETNKSEGPMYEIIYTLESELRAGEHKNVRNLPAILTGRLKAEVASRKR